MIEMPDPSSNPEVSKEDKRGKYLECSEANHWEKLPHASPASMALDKLWTVLGRLPYPV